MPELANPVQQPQTIIEIRPYRGGWQCFEGPGVEAYCGYAKALALYRDELAFLTASDRRWILGGTALRLWPFA